MNLANILKGLAVAAAVTVGSMTAAHAVTVSWLPEGTGALADAAQLIPDDQVGWSEEDASIGGVTKSPYGVSGPRLSNVTKDGYAEYNIVGDYLKFMWGSPDPIPEDYNVIEFFLGGLSQGVFTGADAVAAGGIDATGYIVAIFEGDFDQIRISASKIAFEYVMTAESLSEVPVPPAAALLVTGMAGLGYLGRRRAKKLNA